MIYMHKLKRSLKKRRQKIGKKLGVPENILDKVFDCTLSFDEFIEYKLDDKISISSIIESDRKIVEKFGIEKCKTLDWQLLNTHSNNVDVRDSLMAIDPQVEDINAVLYKSVKDQLRPSNYTSKMKEMYPDRFFDIPQNIDRNLKLLMEKFNNGDVSLKEIIDNWDLFKDKDLSYYLLNDGKNKDNITDSDLKQFMANYGIIFSLIRDKENIYTFINKITTAGSDNEIKDYIKTFTDDILSHTFVKYDNNRERIILTDAEYKEMFKYSSFEDYLKMVGENGYINEIYANDIIEELKTLPKDYIFNIPIPISVFNNSAVLEFIGTYGLKNVVDFDNECGHFFTENNCEMLKLMYDMYLKNAINIKEPEKKIEKQDSYDENGIDVPYTKDEFYEVMRRMIIYGPITGEFMDKAPDYRNMTGEFRMRNAELFISEQAPEELQKLFYTRSITTNLLVEHPEYIEYLKDKRLGSCFKTRALSIDGRNENLYDFLSSKFDFNVIMNFIMEYSDILDIVFDKRNIDGELHTADFVRNLNFDFFLQKNQNHPQINKNVV